MSNTTSENWWIAVWNHAELNYSMNDDGRLLLLLLAVGLIVFAVGIAVHTLLKGRGRRISLRGAASHLLGFVWLLPIAAVCLLVVFYFRSSGDAEHRGDDADLGPAIEATELQQPTFGSDVGPAEERPAWVDADAVDDGSRRLVVVHSRQFSEVQQARQDALTIAVKRVRENFQKTHDLRGSWALPPAVVQAHAVKNTFVELIQRHTDLNEFSVVRVYYQVELSDDVRNEVFASWRNQLVDRRLWILGGLLGFVTLLLGTVATYLRLDALTGGSDRRRLKLASVSLLIAGSLGLATLLPVA